jgi:hypothetical protein
MTGLERRLFTGKAQGLYYTLIPILYAIPLNIL